MQPLKAPASAAARVPDRRAPRDPAPSRLAYRMHRLWLTPLFRALLRTGLPAFALVFTVGLLLADEARRAALVQSLADIRATIEDRPEFQVAAMEVSGASPTVEAALRAVGPQAFPVSSFHIDLEALRAEFEALDAVERADLHIRSGGVLETRVLERTPAIVWRTRTGLELLDAGGHRIAYLRSRGARADLPLIAGDGAN